MRRFLILFLICAAGYAQTIPSDVGVYSLSGSGGSSSGGASSALFASTASGVVANSVAETTIIGTGSGSKTTSANYFTAGSVFVVEATGFYSSQAVDTLTVKIKGGSTVALSTGAVAYGAMTNKAFTVRALITCRTTGVSGTFIANTLFFTGGSALIPQDAQMLNTTTFTLDTTGTIAWDMTAQWSATSASDTITCTNFAMYTVGSSTGGGGGGTVTSVGWTGGLVSVGTPTTTPAFTVAGTSGGIPYFNSASTWASSAALAANSLLIGGGAGVAPASVTTGTGILTALGINTGSAGAPVLFNGAGGTPSAITLTNGTGLVATTGLTATGTKNSTTFLRGDDTWAAPAGSGTVTVVGAGNLTSTALVTGGGAQALQTPSAGSTLDSSGNQVLAGTSTATKFIGSGSTPAAMELIAGTGSIPALTANSAGWAAPTTGGTSYLFKPPATITAGVLVTAAPGTNDGVNESAVTIKTNPSGAFVGTTDTQTLTNKWVQARITTIVSNATPTVNTDNTDVVSITALAAAITSMTTNLSGTPVALDQLEYWILDNGTPRAITWGASFSAGPVALPTTTVTSKPLHVYFERNPANTSWVCMSTSSDL